MIFKKSSLKSITPPPPAPAAAHRGERARGPAGHGDGVPDPDRAEDAGKGARGGGSESPTAVGGPAVPNLFLPDRAIWRAYNGNPYVKSRLRVCRLSRAVGVWLWCPKALIVIPWVRPG